jgi:DNA modification methylase
MITLIHGSFENEIVKIPSGSVDLIATDPPYTNGKKGKDRVDVLAGHKIQTDLDLDFIAKEHYRILKPNSFYAFFGQMPSINEWYNAAYNAGFEWKKQVIWNKKNGNVRGANQIEDIVENIYIFKKGEPKFNKVSVSYEEQARMNIENGLKIDSVFRQLRYWKGVAQGKMIIFITEDFMKEPLKH